MQLTYQAIVTDKEGVDRSVISHQGTAPGHLEQARARLLSPPFARPAAFF